MLPKYKTLTAFFAFSSYLPGWGTTILVSLVATFVLSGCGTAVHLNATPASFSLSANHIDFGQVTIGTTTTQTILLTNTGQSPATVSVSVSGKTAPVFQGSPQCGVVVNGHQCMINVPFSPAEMGQVSGQITVTLGGNPASSQNVSVTGTGITDVLVYAATPSGIMAAIEAGNLGKHVYLIEPSQHVGGMSSNGLGAFDYYNLGAIGGLARQFLKNIALYYGSDVNSKNGTLFEPHVAEQIFNKMIAQQPNITLVLGSKLASVSMAGTFIQGITDQNGKELLAREFIDASYEGDLMAAAHVSYIVGRESTSQYGEALAGVNVPVLPEGRRVDPYVVRGNPSSGLIAHIEPDTLGPPGSADKSVMAYNYRLCFSRNPNNQIPFTAPPNYDPAEFEFRRRQFATFGPPSSIAGL